MKSAESSMSLVEVDIRNSPGKEVSRRWTNLRDAYCKSRKKIQNCKRSGTGASTVKKYIFNNQMQFLEKCYDSRDTEESIDYSVTTEIDNTESIHEKPDEYENTGEIIKEVNVPANRMIRRRRKPDEVDAAVLKASEQPQQQPDTNMSFFHSLKPHLKQFDDSQILQFQIAVLEIISEIKEKEKMTQAPAFPTIPQHCCSHVPLHQQSPKPLSHQHHSSLRCCM
ncbi:uncharacterized protein isoform X2 [Leptinotarsa decemlineata]|uniref:uncharacterized protein isoform X2 n=1 Tax=Leptinotarsa decemlineata TaxID=7539 RepID=UPI003D30BEB1